MTTAAAVVESTPSFPQSVAPSAPQSVPPSRAREASDVLASLLRDERHDQAGFVLALADFDRARLWKELGYPSLFAYLHRALRLSSGAAYYRKAAAGLVQRFPEVIPMLRDGKLCITGLGELAKVITPENAESVLPRFFYKSTREARAVAVAIRPAGVIPRREVVTRLAGSSSPQFAPFQSPEMEAARATSASASSGPAPASSHSATANLPTTGSVPAPAAPTAPASPPPPGTPGTPGAPGVPWAPEPPPFLVEPFSAAECRLHLTVTTRFLAKIDLARLGQSHRQPGASSAEILETALDLLLEAQARRHGAGMRPRACPRPSGLNHVPVSVRRAVWARDGGVCQWPLDSGGICGSAQRVELDHVVPRAIGGPSTVENCRLLCRVHNDLAARLVYGNDWMDAYTGGGAAGDRAGA